MPKTVFLDIDINHSREAYARAAAFVEATDLRYNFSSKNIAELGGRELQSVIDMYALDFDWSSKGNILIHPQPACRLVIELFDQFSPLACENFEAFCTGSHGKSKVSGLSLHYKNVKFHRVVPGFIAQGGDFVMQNGAGGESIWGKKFKDDKGGLSKKHDRVGIVSMCNSGKNSNTCQFFFTLCPTCPQLDGKHVVFGQIVSGMEVLDMMCAAAGTSPDNIPEQDILITECGIWSPDMPAQGYWAPDDTFVSLEQAAMNAARIRGEQVENSVYDVIVLANKPAAVEKFQSVLADESEFQCTYTLDKNEVLAAVRSYSMGSQDTRLVVVTAPAIDEVDREELAEAAVSTTVRVVCAKPNEVVALLRVIT